MASVPESGPAFRLRGFSLIELMTVLVVAAVLLGLAAPSMRTMVESQQITVAANDLFAAISLARSEAIQRGARVDLVPAGDGTTWSQGWVVFIDGNGNQRPDSGEPVVYSRGPVAAAISIKASLTDSRVQYLAYQGSGRTRTNAGPQSPQFGSFLITLGEQQRKVSINMLGRARICNPVAHESC